MGIPLEPNFAVPARDNQIELFSYARCNALQTRPVCRRQHKNGDAPAGQILLTRQVAIRGDEDMELRLRHSEKLAVAQLRPAELECRAYFMAVEMFAQRRWNALIEKHAH